MTRPGWAWCWAWWWASPVGVFCALLASARAGLTRLPAGVSTVQLLGASALCGIGFTMSLFVAELAFRGPPRGDEVKLAIFAGSLISALLGCAVLAIGERTGRGPART